MLLYHLGYLTVSKSLGRGFVFVKIPSEEIKYEFAKFLSKADSCNNNNDDNISFSVDSIRPYRTDRHEMFKTFGDTIKVWYNSLGSKTNCNVSGGILRNCIT